MQLLWVARVKAPVCWIAGHLRRPSCFLMTVCLTEILRNLTTLRLMYRRHYPSCCEYILMIRNHLSRQPYCSRAFLTTRTEVERSQLVYLKLDLRQLSRCGEVTQWGSKMLKVMMMKGISMFYRWVKSYLSLFVRPLIILDLAHGRTTGALATAFCKCSLHYCSPGIDVSTLWHRGPSSLRELDHRSFP